MILNLSKKEIQSPDFKFKKEDILSMHYKNNEFIIVTKNGKFKMPFVDDLYQTLYDKYIAFVDVKETSMIDQVWAREIVKEIWKYI